MPNTVKDQDRRIALWKDRAVVNLFESDGRSTISHGAVLGPVGRDYAWALKALDGCLREAREADPQAWNYDDVLENARKKGFVILSPAEWWEHAAIY